MEADLVRGVDHRGKGRRCLDRMLLEHRLRIVVCLRDGLAAVLRQTEHRQLVNKSGVADGKSRRINKEVMDCIDSLSGFIVGERCIIDEGRGLLQVDGWVLRNSLRQTHAQEAQTKRRETRENCYSNK